MCLSAWHSYRLYEQEMLIFSIKKIGSLLYVGSLEQGMRRNQIREPQDHQNVEIIVTIILYLNSWSSHSISLNDGSSGISIHDIYISFTSCNFFVVWMYVIPSIWLFVIHGFIIILNYCFQTNKNNFSMHHLVNYSFRNQCNVPSNL